MAENNTKFPNGAPVRNLFKVQGLNSISQAFALAVALTFWVLPLFLSPAVVVAQNVLENKAGNPVRMEAQANGLRAETDVIEQNSKQKTGPWLRLELGTSIGERLVKLAGSETRLLKVSLYPEVEASFFLRPFYWKKNVLSGVLLNVRASLVPAFELIEDLTLPVGRHQAQMFNIKVGFGYQYYLTEAAFVTFGAGLAHESLSVTDNDVLPSLKLWLLDMNLALQITLIKKWLSAQLGASPAYIVSVNDAFQSTLENSLGNTAKHLAFDLNLQLLGSVSLFRYGLSASVMWRWLGNNSFDRRYALGIHVGLQLD